MSSDVTTRGTGSVTVLSTKNRVGLVLAVLLALSDLTGPFMTGGAEKTGENGPPDEVLYAAGVLGLITLIAAVYMWRTGNRVAGRIVAASRLLSALTAVPAFFVGGVPAALVAIAATGIILTLIVVGLVLSRPRA